MDDRADSHREVGRLVDDRRRISCAYAYCRLAGAVCRLDHAGTAGRKNEVSFLHNEIGLGKARRLDPCDDILWGAGFHCRVKNDLRRSDRGVLGSRMGADDDAVARLERYERLEDRGGCGVRGGNHRTDHADRLRNPAYAHCGVLLDDAACLLVAVRIVDVLGGIVVLDNLVLGDTHARLGDRHLGKRDALGVSGECGGLENGVHLFLRVGGKLALGGAHPRDECFEFLDSVIRCCGRYRFVCVHFSFLVLHLFRRALSPLKKNCRTL